MESADSINLMILTSWERWSWIDRLTYMESWPGYHGGASFLKASLVSKELDKAVYKQIRVDKNATVSEVIAAARRLLSMLDKNYEKDFEDSGSGEDTWPVSYSLFYPALDFSNRLTGSDRLSDLGVTDGELMFLQRTVHRPPPCCCVLPMKNFADFQKMVASNGDPDEKRGKYDDDVEIYATLLYTDEDVELATFVRKHFDELHKMSGANLMVYVVEEPSKGSAYATSTFWKARLEYTVYLAWSLLGLVGSKPYDKSAVYEIARSLGVYPDQIPSVVLFDNVKRESKIVVPIQGDYSRFFRKLFSTTQRHLGKYSFDRGTIDAQIPMKELKARLFEEMRMAVEKNRVEGKADRDVFNFYDQVAFINRPTRTTIQDFQKS